MVMPISEFVAVVNNLLRGDYWDGQDTESIIVAATKEGFYTGIRLSEF